MSRKRKILIVEDNEPFRQNTRELLEFHQFDVITAENGQEALEMGAVFEPDLILSDIKMPVMNGFKMLRHLRRKKLFPHSRFVFLSGYSERKSIQAALKLGADDYIVKPFTEEELVSKLKRLLGILIFPLFQINDIAQVILIPGWTY